MLVPVLICAAAALALPPAAWGQPPTGGPAAPYTGGQPPNVFLDVDAKPVLDWSLPDRYASSWSAWNSATATYNPDFINPKLWSVNLDGCASKSVYHITSYTFTVAQVGGSWTRTYDVTNCKLNLKNVLPVQGTYNVNLTLHTNMGLSPGVSQPLRSTIGIRDYLIVSMGDSLASGEGNPDVPGVYDVSYGVSCPSDLPLCYGE